MLTPKIEITITDVVTGRSLTFTSVVYVEVESSWKSLTDTAKITLPRNIRILNGNINDIVKRGSSVSIWAGYDTIKYQEFVGYVARLDSKIPFTIYCEDEMWRLKQTSFSHSFKNVKLKDLVSFIYPGAIKVVDFNIPLYRIDRCTGAKVLADIKERYGFFSYFQDQVLHVGFAYDFAIKNEVIHHFQRNVPEAGCELAYKTPEDFKVRVKGISILPGGKTITYTATDSAGEEYNTSSGKVKFDGDEQIWRVYGQTKEQLKKLVDNQIKKYKIGGYTGSITAFGEPFCKHNDVDHYLDAMYPEREGRYLIDKTIMKYGEGYRRVIEPGRKIS